MASIHKIKPDVIIVDDHLIFRQGLKSLLTSKNIATVIGEASNGNEAIRLCRDLKPDVALIDLIMPEVDGVTTIQVIHQDNPDIHIIALSSFNDDALVKAALQAGATGYLLKNISASRLAGAIRASHAGLPTFSPEIAQSILSRQDPPSTPSGNKLTQREKEVLNLIITGLSNAEIGFRLNISTYTVKNHVSNIFVKMNVSSRTEAVSHALQLDK
jgi:DNA-binding NarL/FixJ family response regulator